jgi:hypothetical protein
MPLKKHYFYKGNKMENNISNTGLSYTDLTYDDIMTKVNEKFNSDPKFKNFQESDVGKMMIEMFAGMTDILNYNIERTAQESYFSTLTRYRSAVKHANDMSYDIQRATPAKASIKIRIDGTSALIGNRDISNNSDESFFKSRLFKLPKNTTLAYEGSKFILTDELVYEFSLKELRDLSAGNSIIIETTGIGMQEKTISILQAESKMIELKGTDFKDNFDSTGEGNIFQRYVINDVEFSNFYGEHDPYNSSTVVAIGETYESAIAKNTHTIHRQSLITGKEIESRSLAKAKYYKNDYKSRTIQESNELYYEDNISNTIFNKNVWIKTSAEVNDAKGIELKFGDGVTLSKGLSNTKESLYVVYLATTGSKGNKYGVIGEQIQITKIPTAPWTQYLKVTPILTSNVLGGSDIESLESIKNRAPGMFQTFNRLVTKKDYVSFLRTLTSPIDVKNAIAWGEQDELVSAGFLNGIDESEIEYRSISKLFNVVLYTVIGSLYEEQDGVYRPKTNMYNAMLDSYSSNVIYPSQNYISVLAQKQVVKQLKLDNKLLEGSIPIEHFKYEISNDPVSDSIGSSFTNFMSNVGIRHNMDMDVSNIITDTNAYEMNTQVVTVPYNLVVTLTNPTASLVTPITLDINTFLGKNLNLKETFDFTENNIAYTKTGAVDLNLPDRRPLFSDIDDTSISTYNIISEEFTIAPEHPLYSYTPNTGVKLIIDPAIHAAMVNVPNKILSTPKLDDEFTSRLNVNTHGLLTSTQYYLNYNFVTDFYLNLAQLTTSKLVEPKNIFAQDSILEDTNYEVIAPGDEGTLNLSLDVDFIDKAELAYTPWGIIVNELSDELNTAMREQVSSVVNNNNNDEVNRFNFFNMTCNVEQDDEEESDTYIDRMLSQELSKKFSVDFESLDTVKEIQGQHITQAYIDANGGN